MPEPEPAGQTPAGAPDPLASIETRVRHLEEPFQLSTKAADTGLAREAKDRSWIAKAILVVFVGSVAIVLAIFLTEGILTAEWPQVAAQAADLIKTSVLPVVTLVLGFYFGSRSDKG